MTTMNVRDRVWRVLRRRGPVTVVTLSVLLGVSSERVLVAMMPDMTEGDLPPVYCQPTDDGPRLVPRRLP